MYAARRNRNRFRNLAKRDLSDLSLRRSGPLRPAPVRYLRFSDNANPLSSGNGGLPRLDSGAPLWCGSFDAGRGKVPAYGRQPSEEIPIQVVRKSTEIVDGTTRVKVEGRAGHSVRRCFHEFGSSSQMSRCSMLVWREHMASPCVSRGTRACRCKVLDPDQRIEQLNHSGWTGKYGAPREVRALAQTSDGFPGNGDGAARKRGEL